MIFLSVVGGVIVVALVLAGWYDHRVKRGGGRVRVGASAAELEQRRLDIELMKDPRLIDGQQDSKNWQERNR
jgi:hypothetical protein